MSELCGIYLITVVRLGELPAYYVGQSVNFKRRTKGHIKSLRKGNHRNKRLQHIWNKYGESSFCFSFLEECSHETLDEREQWWLDEMHGYERCVNFAKCASSPMRGKSFSPDHKSKIGKANKGRVHTEETRRRMSEAKAGRSNHTAEWIDHLKRSMKGDGNHFFGKQHSDETRRTISEKALSRPVTKEVIERARLAGLAKARAVEMVCKETGAVVKRYESISDAARDGHTMSSIISVLHGRLRTHHGHDWRYA